MCLLVFSIHCIANPIYYMLLLYNVYTYVMSRMYNVTKLHIGVDNRRPLSDDAWARTLACAVLDVVIKIDVMVLEAHIPGCSAVVDDLQGQYMRY